MLVETLTRLGNEIEQMLDDLEVERDANAIPICREEDDDEEDASQAYVNVQRLLRQAREEAAAAIVPTRTVRGPITREQIDLMQHKMERMLQVLGVVRSQYGIPIPPRGRVACEEYVHLLDLFTEAKAQIAAAEDPINPDNLVPEQPEQPEPELDAPEAEPARPATQTDAEVLTEWFAGVFPYYTVVHDVLDEDDSSQASEASVESVPEPDDVPAEQPEQPEQPEPMPSPYALPWESLGASPEADDPPNESSDGSQPEQPVPRSQPEFDRLGHEVSPWETFARENSIERQRERSGGVTDTDALTCFLYLLMRDELPVGTVERLVLESLNPHTETTCYTNGWLAKYAQDIVERMQTPPVTTTEKPF